MHGHGGTRREAKARCRTRLDRADPSLVRERFMPDQELLVLASENVVRDDRCIPEGVLVCQELEREGGEAREGKITDQCCASRGSGGRERE